MENKLTHYMLEQLEKLVNIPSPTGYTMLAQEYIISQLKDMGLTVCVLNKGGVICDLGGEGEPLMLAAHIDTLGAVVRTIKSSGALRVTPVGGLNANNVETETVKVITRFNGEYDGTFQLENASIHVNSKFNAERDFNTTLEILLDEKTSSKEDTEKLGVSNGDIIAVNPRFTITDKGYIKSRFLDDKASAAILLTLAKAITTREVTPKRKIYINFTVYEEVGHGGAAGIPSDVVEMISVDMGCVGDGLTCKETQVSICAKDSGGPYNYDVITKLIEAAKKADIDYAVDIYPSYGSDVEASLRAGYDIRHALIGPGVYASHGYERTHIDGMNNTYNLIKNFII